jgi:hypothetical protein
MSDNEGTEKDVATSETKKRKSTSATEKSTPSKRTKLQHSPIKQDEAEMVIKFKNELTEEEATVSLFYCIITILFRNRMNYVLELFNWMLKFMICRKNKCMSVFCSKLIITATLMQKTNTTENFYTSIMKLKMLDKWYSASLLKSKALLLRVCTNSMILVLMIKHYEQVVFTRLLSLEVALVNFWSTMKRHISTSSVAKQPRHISIFNVLPQELIAHVGEFLPVEECCIIRSTSSNWYHAMIHSLHAHITRIDSTLKEHGNVFKCERKLETRYDEPSRYNSDCDSNDSYQARDIHTSIYTDNISFTINTLEQKMSDDDFDKFAELNVMEEGYRQPFKPTNTGIIINTKDRPINDDVEETEEDEVSALEDDVQENLTNLLGAIHSAKKKVVSEETNKPFDKNYEYQLYYLMHDGTVWHMKLDMASYFDRYSSYNE